MDVFQYIMSSEVISVIVRIVLSSFLGAIVGIDRVRKKRPAGIKTHALVCMGSALVMITGEFLYYKYDGGTDVARLAAQVISGIGFLGAGTIMITGKSQIKGLTTAAGLWFAACLGLAVGCGFYLGSFVSVIMMYIIIRLFDIVDKKLQNKSMVMDLYIELKSKSCVSTVLVELKKLGCHIVEIEHMASISSDDVHYITISLGIKKGNTHQSIIQVIKNIDGVSLVEEI